jgi:hypothetical protein
MTPALLALLVLLVLFAALAAALAVLAVLAPRAAPACRGGGESINLIPSADEAKNLCVHCTREALADLYGLSSSGAELDAAAAARSKEQRQKDVAKVWKESCYADCIRTKITSDCVAAVSGGPAALPAFGPKREQVAKCYTNSILAFNELAGAGRLPLGRIRPSKKRRPTRSAQK